jgi:hypothetical protein
MLPKHSYDVVSNSFKYIHCDLIDALRYFSIILIVGLTFVTTFFPRLNLRLYIQVTSWGNNINRTNWSIPHKFVLCCHHTIHTFIQRSNLEPIGTLEMIVIGIYGKFAKTFILVVANGLEASDKRFFFTLNFIYNMCNWWTCIALAYLQHFWSSFWRVVACDQFFKHVCNPCT